MEDKEILDGLQRIPSNYELQTVYKLASIETAVKELSRRFDDGFARLKDEMVGRHLEMLSSFNKLESSAKAEDVRLEGRIDENRRNIAVLIKWKESMTTRISMIGVLAFGIWAVVGDTIKNIIGKVL